MAKQFTLGKSERIKSKKMLDALFTAGEKFNVSGYRVFYRMTGNENRSLLQFGVGVSSRNFKSAVSRNRIKRLTRESWRLQKTTLQEALVEKQKCLAVFFIFTGNEVPEYQQAFNSVGKALQQLQTIAGKSG